MKVLLLRIFVMPFLGLVFTWWHATELKKMQPQMSWWERTKTNFLFYLLFVSGHIC